MKPFKLALFVGQNYPGQLLVSSIAYQLRNKGHSVTIFVAQKEYPVYQATILGTIQYLINGILYQDIFPFLDTIGYAKQAKCLTTKQLSNDFEVYFITRKQLDDRAIIEQLATLDGGISLCFPFIFKAALIQCLSTKNNLFWNLHSACLPEYPGLGGVKWAMYDQQVHTSSTLHEIHETIDTGSILATKPQPIDYALDYYSNWLALIPNAIKMVLENIERVSLGQPLQSYPNDPSKVRRYGKRTTLEAVRLIHEQGIRFFNLKRLQQHYLEHFSERGTVHEQMLSSFLEELFGRMELQFVP